MITKLEISQKYNFSTLLYWSYFIIDFDKKIVFFDGRVPIWVDEFDEDSLNYFSFDDNFKLFLEFSNNFSNKNHKLNAEKINNFHKSFNQLHLFDNHKQCETINIFDNFDKLSEIEIKIHKNSEIERYDIINEYPKKWIEFGKILEDLLGFDLLNIENLKYLVTELYFSIKSDGVYLKDEKLKLTKFNYYYKGRIICRSSCFSIDFIKKTICSLAEVNCENCHNKLENGVLLKIMDLIEKYAVYKWYRPEFLFNDIEDRAISGFDGMNWYIELIFDDKYILHLGGYDHPDNYIKFGRELFKLINVDLL